MCIRDSISDDSHDNVAEKKGGGFAVSLSCPALPIDDRRFTLETLSAGLVSCSSHDGTDASHTTTVLWILDVYKRQVLVCVLIRA